MTALGTPRRTPRVLTAGAVALLLSTGCTTSERIDGDVQRYVALGDSMTSAPYLPVVDPAGGCFRSSQNYPSRLARELDPEEFVDVSCGGAGTEHLDDSQFPGVAPQLAAVTDDTDLVTLTLGANDFGIFETLFGDCVRLAPGDPSGAPCRAAAEDEVTSHVDAVRDRLVESLESIRRAAPDATVVLLGYPRLVPDSGTCPDRLPLAAGDHAFVREAMSRLDRRQREAAERAGVRFLDVYAASEGHDVCSDTPWVNGMTSDPEGALALHPFPREQEAVAELLARSLAETPLRRGGDGGTGPSAPST